MAAGLVKEVSLHPEARGRTLYIGGGTPNLLGVGELGELIARARDRFRLPQGAEVSIESNPGANSGVGYFEALYRAGLTRLSVGSQSFNDGELRMLGRLHRSQDTEIFTSARRGGIRSISIDLMYGLPGQVPGDFIKNLESALTVGVDHVSLYALKLVPATPLGLSVERGELPPPDPDATADAYYASVDYLEAEGFMQYELSNFARPGHRCRHNEIYWEAEPFIGIGPSAVGDDGEVRCRNTPDLEAWLSSVEKGVTPDRDVERPTPAQRRMEMGMLALRTRAGLSERRFQERFGVSVAQAFPALEEHRAEGRLVLSRGRWRIAREHQFITDRVLCDLAD